MGIVKHPDHLIPVDADGWTLCACGCKERIVDGEEIATLQTATVSQVSKRCYGSSDRALVKTSHITGANAESFQLEALKDLTLRLASKDKDALKKLYLFMHNALGCRI